MKIVLTGSTGNLGKLILKQLLFRCRAEDLILSVRQPPIAEEYTDPNLGIRYGDYDVPESLEPAFRGAAKLMMVSSPCMDDVVRLQQHLSVIEAARQAGIKHIVYTSICSPEKGRLSVHKLHLDTEQAIRESNIPYTILRNAYYTDIVKLLGIREAAASGVLVSPPGHWIFNTASRWDLAHAAAVVLTEEGHEDRTYELAPMRTWNLDDLASSISEVTGRKVVRRTDNDYQNHVYRMLPYSDMRFVSKDLARLVGQPLRTVTDEVRDIFG
ncbi:NAD(P)H-binding protein [Paenibacillus ginsengarvi]|uniref:SDR family NAD(P)-dependent oxidoreductase n=1 Tax=Paenibacillus ginsengarvi TaxID=400777 RepID=A0A3B0CSY2_9BACL|nr:NAD(P)H-binding protein [Paenibacillus ginsengarvi]RKN86337.1 SDR family NAD(P)-dependent oxidoreductase [Paenibacillus ginsengarvi]